MITIPEASPYTTKLDNLSPMVLGALLSEAPEAAKPELLGRRLGCKSEAVKWLLNQPPIPDFEGPAIRSMSFQDIGGLTLTRATHLIEAILIARLSTVLCVNLLARFVGRPEWDVRRMQKRAIRLGLLYRDVTGRLREGPAPKPE